MSDPANTTIHTIQLHGWLERMRAGDQTARDELVRSVCGRLEHLAHQMLRRYPNVQRWAETGDVLTNAVMRLLRALREVQPESMARFYGLAAEQMRRELLDLARHYRGVCGRGIPLASDTGGLPEPADPAADPRDLDRWSSFHEEVERLPAEEREVVGLIFYHGWSQGEVADLFGVNTRTIHRRWQAALRRLSEVLSDLPQPT